MGFMRNSSEACKCETEENTSLLERSPLYTVWVLLLCGKELCHPICITQRTLVMGWGGECNSDPPEINQGKRYIKKSSQLLKSKKSVGTYKRNMGSNV